MIKPLAKILTLVMMLTAFIGESYAALAMPCDMAQVNMQTSNHEMHNMHDMNNIDTNDHSMHMSQDEQTSDQQGHKSDCCDDNCQCPMSTVSQVSLLSSFSQIELLNFSKTRLLFNQNKAKQQIPTSLYRPPIAA